MTMLLAILLWIGCIASPNTYHISVINNNAYLHAPIIGSVMDNATLQTMIWDQHGAAAQEVQVVDPFQ